MSLSLTAATAIVLLMHAGNPTPEVPELPAAATTVTPLETALFTALVILGYQPSQFDAV